MKMIVAFVVLVMVLFVLVLKASRKKLADLREQFLKDAPQMPDDEFCSYFQLDDEETKRIVLKIRQGIGNTYDLPTDRILPQQKFEQLDSRLGVGGSDEIGLSDLVEDMGGIKIPDGVACESVEDVIRFALKESSV